MGGVFMILPIISQIVNATNDKIEEKFVRNGFLSLTTYWDWLAASLNAALSSSSSILPIQV